MKTGNFSHTLYIVILIFAFFYPFGSRAATVIPENAWYYGNETWMPSGNPYIVSNLYIASSSTLTIKPGVIIKLLPRGQIHILGNLYVGDASSTLETYFTSIADSSIGGDTRSYIASSTALDPNALRWNNIEFLNNATTDIHYADFRFGGGIDPNECRLNDSCTIGNYQNEFSIGRASVFISDSTFEKVPASFFTLIEGTVDLERDRFNGGNSLAHVANYDDPEPLNTLIMHGSSITNINNEIIQYEHGSFIGDVMNNWWGDASGPRDEFDNPNGSVSLGYRLPFIPWLRSDPFSTFSLPEPIASSSNQSTTSLPEATSTSGISNILFLPGTLESRLYMRDENGKEKRLWEPTQDADISLLSMNEQGSSTNRIYTRDIIDSLYSDSPLLSSAVRVAIGDRSNLYKPFETFMDSLVKDGTIQKWIAYPYDWRYDVSEIPSRNELVGQPTGAITEINLQDVLQQLASSSPTGKVTIIAHSEGGLVAKALAIELQKKGKLQLIDHIIFVGVPQTGTPEAIGVLLHGDGQTHALGLISYSGTARAVSKTMPGAYELLPSLNYFSQVHTPPVTFESEYLQKYIDAIGRSVTSFEGLRNFLIDTPGGRGRVSTHDLKTPETLYYSILEKAKAAHDEQDTWTPPSNVSLTSIVGWGVNTVSNYSYSSPGKTSSCGPLTFSTDCTISTLFKRSMSLTTDGDGMVVSPSAAGIRGDTLYFNSEQYQKDSGTSIDHQSLLSAKPIQDALRDLITRTQIVEPYLSKGMPTGNKSPLLVVSVHSPANILVRDTEGHETGIVPAGGLPDFYFTKESIPGSTVEVLDDEKYIYLPDTGETYSVTLTGYNTGRATLEVGKIGSQGFGTTTQVITNLPVTPAVSFTFSLQGDVLRSANTSEQTPSSLINTSLNNSPHGVSGSSVKISTLEKAPANAFASEKFSYSKDPQIRYLQLVVKLLTLELQLARLEGRAK